MWFLLRSITILLQTSVIIKQQNTNSHKSILFISARNQTKKSTIFDLNEKTTLNRNSWAKIH